MASRDRGYLREQRDRVIAKRAAQYKRVTSAWSKRASAHLPARPSGMLVHEQAWLGCRRANCGLCNAGRDGVRVKDRRAAMAHEATANG